MKLTIEGVGKRYKGDFWGLRGFTLELGPQGHRQREALDRPEA
jgi:hypothetical protein